MFDEQISFMCRSMVGGSGALVICDPLVAKRLVEQGYDTKEKLIDWCANNALLTAREYWDNQSVQLLRPKAVAGVEPYASRLKAGSRARTISQ